MPPSRPALRDRYDRRQQALVTEAARVFARRGFHGASVDDVAAAAGYSTGAVYSNFAGKEDLFLAGFEHEVMRHLGEVGAAVAEASTPAEKTQAAAAQWMEFLHADRERFLLFLEYMAYSLRNPRLRRDFHLRETRFSPVPVLGGLINSQAWFICSPR